MAVIKGTYGKVKYDAPDKTIRQLVMENKHNLYGADLRGQDLSDLDLSGADLESADLRGTNLKGAVSVAPTFPNPLGTAPQTSVVRICGARF